MTGESNPEERPVDSTTGDTESEPPVLVDSDSSENSPSATDSSDSVASSSSDSEATSTSDTQESGRLGSLDPTVKVKRPDSVSDDSSDGEESSESTDAKGDDSTDSEAVKRTRRPSAKTPAAIQASQRRQTPGAPRDQRRQRPGAQSAHGSGKPELMSAVLQNLQQLTTRATHLESNTQKIARALVEIVKEGENRKRAYDVLYDEMRQYKENFLWQCQKPLFMDLITLFDSILRVERQYEAMEGMEKVAGDFRYLKDELLETLYRYDVELIEEHPDRLDIGFQKPIKRVDTDDPAEDRAVVKVVREGFAREGMILRPQEIVVKRYSESKEG